MIPIRTFIEPQIIEGKYEKGDYFLLASDAIAKYFLIQDREKKWTDIWNNLLANDREWYDNFIDEERISKNLDDDDVTILIVPTVVSEELKPGTGFDIYSIGNLSSKDKNREKENNNVSNIEDSIPLYKENSSETVEESKDVKVDGSEIELKSDALKSEPTEKNTPSENNNSEIVEGDKLSNMDEKGSANNSLNIDPQEISNTQNIKCEHSENIKTSYSEEKIVILIFDDDIVMKENHSITSALIAGNIPFIECRKNEEILYLSGVLILFQKKKYSLSRNVIKTYYRFSKEERVNYFERKSNKVFIEEIGILQHSYNIIEIKKELI